MSTDVMRVPLWTCDDVARYLRVSTRTVRRRAADGTIPAVRIGGTLRFEPDAVTSAVANRPAHEVTAA
jgi:excisionase family DNA binding protein